MLMERGATSFQEHGDEQWTSAHNFERPVRQRGFRSVPSQSAPGYRRALAAIELNDQSSLPPHPFSRGFVRTYAEEVDLDPDGSCGNTSPSSQGSRGSRRPRHAAVPTEPSSQPSSRWMGMGTAVAILLVVVVAAVVLGRRGDRAADPTRRYDRSVARRARHGGTHRCRPAADPVRRRGGGRTPPRNPAPAAIRGPVDEPPVLGRGDGRWTTHDLPGAAARRSSDPRGRACHHDPLRRRGGRNVDDQWPGRRFTRRGRRDQGHEITKENAATFR